MKKRIGIGVAGLFSFALACSAAVAAGGGSPQQILVRQGCTGCHAEKTKRLGPPWAWIAYRYRNTPSAKARLQVAGFIRGGGQGYWKAWTGGIPMPPHPEMSRGQAEALAGWILSQPPAAPPNPGG